MIVSQALAACCGFILGCGFFVSNIVWFVFGLTTRFNDYGQFAAGAKIPNGKTEEAWQKEINADGSLY